MKPAFTGDKLTVTNVVFWYTFRKTGRVGKYASLRRVSHILNRPLELPIDMEGHRKFLGGVLLAEVKHILRIIIWASVSESRP